VSRREPRPGPRDSQSRRQEHPTSARAGPAPVFPVELRGSAGRPRGSAVKPPPASRPGQQSRPPAVTIHPRAPALLQRHITQAKRTWAWAMSGVRDTEAGTSEPLWRTLQRAASALLPRLGLRDAPKAGLGTSAETARTSAYATKDSGAMGPSFPVSARPDVRFATM